MALDGTTQTTFRVRRIALLHRTPAGRPSRRRFAQGSVAVLLIAASVFVWIGTAAAHTPHDPSSDVELSPSYARDGKVFAVSASRLLVGDGTSSTWTQLVNGLPRSPENGESIAQVAISPSDERIMYVSSRVGGVFRS